MKISTLINNILRCKLILVSLLLLISLNACEEKEDPNSSNLLKDLNQQFTDLTKDLKDSWQKDELDNLASSELEKLFTFEYKVIELSSKLSSIEIEVRLNRLGQDRWECFSIRPHSDKILVTCKRRPKSYLRYIPRVF